LETTAIYDADKQEFVLNTPTITAHKFWPGGCKEGNNVVCVVSSGVEMVMLRVHRTKQIDVRL